MKTCFFFNSMVLLNTQTDMQMYSIIKFPSFDWKYMSMVEYVLSVNEDFYSFPSKESHKKIYHQHWPVIYMCLSLLCVYLLITFTALVG